MQPGWLKIAGAAKYADLSPRTLRSLLKEGELKHSRLRSGTILIKREHLDDYLEKFTVERGSSIDAIVDDAVRSLSK